MYCRKCGKFIDYDADYCDECIKAEQDSAITGKPVEPVQPAQPNYQQPPYPNYQQPAYNQQQGNYYPPYNAQGEPNYYDYGNQAPQQNNQAMKKNGFGKALTATILGGIAFVIAYAILMSIYGELISFIDYGSSYYIDFVAEALTGFILTLPAAIIALVFGTKSIKTFKSTLANYKVKPIPTLILGIVGTVTGATTIIVDLCFFMLLLV